MLSTGSSLPIDTQRDVMYACVALMNFMQLQGEAIDADENRTENLPNEIDDAMTPQGGGRADARGEAPLEMKGLREEIARTMWRQYQDYRRDNGYH